MNTNKKPYRLAYNYKFPNHRLTPENLEQLKANSDRSTIYPAIHLTVLHMGTYKNHAIPDHDVYVNTQEMTYYVVLHGKSMCLTESEKREGTNRYIEPCECQEAPCRKCHQPFMATSSWCIERTSCSEPECQYCTHYREECATEELTDQILEATQLWHTHPERDAPKTPYHGVLEAGKTEAKLTLAEAFSIAVAEVLEEDWPSLHPIVANLLNKFTPRKTTPPLNTDYWMFSDCSYIEEMDGSIYPFTCQHSHDNRH